VKTSHHERISSCALGGAGESRLSSSALKSAYSTARDAPLTCSSFALSELADERHVCCTMRSVTCARTVRPSATHSGVSTVSQLMRPSGIPVPLSSSAVKGTGPAAARSVASQRW
jgi:hypothetical protein